MNILVTGGAGYVGSIVCEELVARNHTPLILDNLQQGHRGAVLPGAKFILGDIGNPADLEAVFSQKQIDAVMHMAAETVVEYSMTDPARYFHNNIVAGLNLLDVMVKHGVKNIVFSSSAATYGEPARAPIEETDPQSPVNSYGETKLMFEKVLAWYGRAYGVRHISFRYFNAAGASERLGEDHRPETHLIPAVLNAARNGTAVRVFGTDYPTRDGSCIRDYVHVRDIAQAHVLALDHLEPDSGGSKFEVQGSKLPLSNPDTTCSKFEVQRSMSSPPNIEPRTSNIEHRSSNLEPPRSYNLGNGDGYSVLEVIAAAEKVCGRKIRTELSPRRPGDPAVLLASSSRAKSELGWRPQFSDISVILKSAWQWMQSHPEGYLE
jgi:UDP-glucose 4-epimerase